MTHLFDVETDVFRLVKSGIQTFDLIYTDKPVSSGDTFIYQNTEVTEKDDVLNQGTTEEIALTVEFIMAKEGLKKGWLAVGFKHKEN